MTKNIKVKEETWKRLQQDKLDLSLKSADDVIKYLYFELDKQENENK